MAGTLRMRARSEHAVLAATASSTRAAFLTATGYATLAFPRDLGSWTTAEMSALLRHHGCAGMGSGQLAGAAWALDANGLLLSKKVWI